MKIGVLGLGKMGSRISQKLTAEGHEVIGWNRSEAYLKGIKVASSIEDLVSKLDKPRVTWLMLPSGIPTEEVLTRLKKHLERGDILIDGGNGHFSITQKRYEEFKKVGIEFLGIGVSGGILAIDNGFPLMVGGSKKAYHYIQPILRSLSNPHGGYEYFGEGGAGHFVKMVHNGIEYGIMQSMGEGFEVLEKSDYKFDLLKIAKLWQRGTLVSGFILDRSVDVISQNPKLDGIKGFIEESGEARWTVEEAKKEGVVAEIIERSLEYRRRSQKDKKIQNSFTAKMVAALRNAFGGHTMRK